MCQKCNGDAFDYNYKTVNDFPDRDKRNIGRLVRKGAQVLNDRPWAQLEYYTPTTEGTAVCAVGAINVALCGNPMPKRFPKVVLEANELFNIWSGYSTLMDYNDAMATSKQDVIDIMNKFADEFDPQ